MQPSAKAMISFLTWVTERTTKAILDQGNWTQELEDWALCVEKLPPERTKSSSGTGGQSDLWNHHYVEPPIPSVTGLLTQIVLNYEGVDVKDGDTRCKAMAEAVEFVSAAMGYDRQSRAPGCPVSARRNLPTQEQALTNAAKAYFEAYKQPIPAVV